jgi:hypothetical protein
MKQKAIVAKGFEWFLAPQPSFSPSVVQFTSFDLPLR